MQFADEELRDLVRCVFMRIGAAGHAELVERITAVQAEAERTQDARERGFARRQRTGMRPAHRAQRAVIEVHRTAAFDRVGRIGATVRRTFEQPFEQRHVHRLRDFRARDDVGFPLFEDGRHVQGREQGVGLRLSQQLRQQALDIRIAHQDSRVGGTAGKRAGNSVAGRPAGA